MRPTQIPGESRTCPPATAPCPCSDSGVDASPAARILG